MTPQIRPFLTRYLVTTTMALAIAVSARSANSQVTKLQAQLSAQIASKALGLEAEAASSAGLAMAVEQATPAAGDLALRNAQRQDPTLRLLFTYQKKRQDGTADRLISNTTKLRERSNALLADSKLLAAASKTAENSPVSLTLSNLTQINLSEPSKLILDPGRVAIVRSPGRGSISGGPDPFELASTGGAIPFIIGGNRTADFPSVGALVFADGAGREFVNCTATLIAPDVVLTARHCLEKTPKGVYFQHAGLFTTSATNQPVVFPSFTYPRGDIGLVFLKSSVTGITPAQINELRQLASATEGQAVGFGFRAGAMLASASSDIVPIVAQTGLKLHARVSTVTCGQTDANSSLICWKFAPELTSFDDTGSTCEGDSGGPLFVKFDEGWRVVGVTTGGRGIGGAAICEPGSQALDTEVFDYAGWINREMAARSVAAPPPSWADSLDPVENPRRFISPPASDHTFFDEGGVIGPTVFDLPTGLATLRVMVNGSDDPNKPLHPPIRSLDVKGPNGTGCHETNPSLLMGCEIPGPLVGIWSIQIVGIALQELQISVVAFKAAS